MTPDNKITTCPDIFNPRADLPQAVRMVGGIYNIDQAQIYEGNPGPHNCVFSFGKSLHSLTEAYPLGTCPSGVFLESKGGNFVARAVNNLTLLANLNLNRDGFDWWDDLSLAKLYAANFTYAFKRVFDKACINMRVEHKDTVLFAPLRGGKIVHIIAKAMGYDFIVPSMRASRVILKDKDGLPGDYMVGISYSLSEDKKELTRAVNCTRAIFADDCLAAGGSQAAIYEWWKRNLQMKNLKPEAVAIVAGVGVLRTAGKQAERLQRLGLTGQSPAVYLAGAAYSMSEDYYLTISPEQKLAERRFQGYDMRVGDMGRIMSLQTEERVNALMPIINKVVTGGITLDEVLHITNLALTQPDRLYILSSRLGKNCNLQSEPQRPGYILA